MNTDAYLAVVRPVNYYDGGEYIWGTGTCFFVKYQDDAYLVTAEHVLSTSSADLSKLHVWLENSKSCVNFNGSWRYSRVVDFREENEDLVVLRVSRRSAHYDRIMQSAIHIPRQVFIASQLNVGERIDVCGYPSATKEYDGLDVTFTDELLFRGGVYSGATNELYKVCCSPSNHVLGGMSGSPVFLNKNGLALLVGLLVAASDDGRFMHFLPVEHVISLIAKVPKYSPLISGCSE
ncbi:trypsin-like peptidase domain-containing protein [Pseudomonas chlororaphis]|uniref:trypsin-like peptidase domain-containing protein n=1 Tax=Pseudomonas chlororaphis TaxID=587753 RepID=UPI0039E0C76D